MPLPTPIALSPAHAAFIQGNVVIYASSADANCRTHLAHCFGCRVHADNTIVTYIDSDDAAALIADVRCNGKVAVAFAHPGTEQALQLKAVNAEIVVAAPDADAVIADYCARLIAHTIAFGFSATMLGAYFSPPARCIGLRFKPYIVFDQTPGPHAGAQLEAMPC